MDLIGRQCSDYEYLDAGPARLERLAVCFNRPSPRPVPRKERICGEAPDIRRSSDAGRWSLRKLRGLADPVG